VIDGLTALGAACLLASVHTTVARQDDGWLEQTTYTVHAQGAPCPGVDLDLPPGAHLQAHGGKARIAAGRRKLDEAHWERLPARLDGWTTWRVHLPELGEGAEATLDVTVLRQGDAPLCWRPGAEGARYAEIEARDLQAIPYGPWKSDGRHFWALHPAPLDEIRVHAGDPTTPAIPVPLASTVQTPPEQSAMEALADLQTLLLLPRGVDGPAPVTGDTAMRRAAVDDRGFARTLVMRSAGGPDHVVLGEWLPARNHPGHADAEEGEVAVCLGKDGPQILRHPDQPARGGKVWTAQGVLDIPAPAHPEPSHDPFAAATRAEPTVFEQVVRRLDLPDGAAPMTALYPGGASTMAVRDAVVFPVDGRARPWVLDLPARVQKVGARTQPPNVPAPLWTLRMRDGSAAIVVGPNAQRLGLLFEWTQPDAPACGLTPDRPGRRADEVLATSGTVVDDGAGAWHLASWGDTPVIPDRDRLVAGLEHRFDARSMPEPALPTRMKFAKASWELATELRPTLWDRARVGPVDQPAGWPRGLAAARRSGAVTPLEAALILRLYAQQSGFQASWAMVRPAWERGPAPVCPAAYPEALVRLTLGDETRWIDPGCAVCGPFEIRPELLGAAALGPGITQTPTPVPGKEVVEVTAERVRWTLDGPPALRFRAWVSGIPNDDRARAIAERLAGKGATLEGTQGLADAGTRLVMIAKRPPGPFAGEDPTALPAPMPSGKTWMGWTGERRLVVAAAEPGPSSETTVPAPGATWKRVGGGTGITVSLTVTDRVLDAAARAVLATAGGPSAAP